MTASPDHATASCRSGPRLLLVARGFPPASDPTAYRWLRFASGLVQRGWNVEVLTAGYVPRLEYYDPDLVRRVPSSITVHRAHPGFYDARVAGARIAGASKSGSNGKASPDRQVAPGGTRGVLRGVLRALDERLLDFKIPDHTHEWIIPGILLGARLLAQSRFDLIVSSGAPFSSHVVAHGLRQWSRAPWIADFSDPYAANPFVSRPGWRRVVDQCIEASWFRSLAGVIVPVKEMRQMFIDQHPEMPAESIHVLPYGFDESMYAGTTPRAFDGFTIVHTGVFYPGMRDPGAFLQALALTRDLPIRVVHAGPLQPEYADRIAALGVAERFDILGMLSRESIAPLQLGAACLLLIGNKGGLQLPGKLLDYLGARRPILALRNDTHDIAANVVAELGAGRVVANEPTQIAAALRELYRAWQAGTLDEQYEHSGAAEYSWTHIEDVLDRRLRAHLADAPGSIGGQAREAGNHSRSGRFLK